VSSRVSEDEQANDHSVLVMRVVKDRLVVGGDSRVSEEFMGALSRMKSFIESEQTL
jgi:hypothetical protein